MYANAAGRTWHLGWGAASVVSVVSAWQEVLVSWKPDVIMLCGFRANMLGRAFSGGAVVVNALRSIFIDDAGRPLVQWLDRATFGRVAACVSNSQAAIDRHIAAGFPPERFHRIPNGIDLNRFRSARRESARAKFSIRADQRVVLSVANLRPVKNIPLLLRSAKYLSDRGGLEKVWIVGEGPDRVALQELTELLGLGEVVSFLGATKDLEERYAAADVFALTSHFEGMPTVVLEAFAAGLPVVATAVGDVPLLCRDTGVLVRPGDERGMAEAIERVLVDQRFREGLKASAMLASEAYSVEAMADRYASLLLRLVSQGRGWRMA